MRVDGRDLHLDCRGEGRPTVLVEAGSGSWSVDWRPAQAFLSTRYRVCTYDRAGYGWSDPTDGPRHAEAIGADLHELVHRSGIARPFVLVGHSLGGLYAKAYAMSHPKDLLGLVLLDARHEDVHDLLPVSVVHRERQAERLYTIGGLLSRFGVLRLLGPGRLGAPELPDASAEVWWAQADQPRFFETVRKEVAAIERSNAQVRGHRVPVPLVVVRHGEHGMFGDHEDAEAAEAAWRFAQEDLLHQADRGTLIVAEGSGHDVHLQSARAVRAAIEEVVRLREASR